MVGTFDSGHYEYDSALAMIHAEDAARVLLAAGAPGKRLALPPFLEPRRAEIEAGLKPL